MTGSNKPLKSRLSTSNKRLSSRDAYSSSYEQLERRNLLATFVVNTIDDVVAEDGFVSLREAVTAANTNMPFSDVGAGEAEGDRIVFAPEVREQTFTLDAQLDILDDLIIRGFQSEGVVNTRLEGLQNRLLNIDTNERVYIRDIAFSRGIAERGGLANVNEGGNVTFASSVLENGIALERGGAVFATDSRLVFIDTEINSNTAGERGGGIATEGGEVILLEANLTSNLAEAGGGVFVDDGARLFSADTTFLSNTATFLGGGAIWADSGTNVQLNSSSFENNGRQPDSANAQIGGAIASRGESLRTDQSRFIGNFSDRGGAIHSVAERTTLIQTQFSDNFAENQGGAVWISTGEARIIGGQVSNNRATREGGGLVFFPGSGSGATPEIAVIQNVTISNNSAESGGAILSRGVDLRILHSTISDNSATRRGGALDSSGTDLYVLDTDFEFNSVSGFGTGGAISSVGSSSLIEDSRFESNSANSGGAISTRTNDNLTLLSSSLNFNSSNGGGAINVGGNATVGSFASTFESNSANTGAAVLVLGTGRFVARGTTFTANTATAEGGAISNFGTANLANSVFTANTAIRGGAIKVGGAGGLLSIEGSTRFVANVAGANGSAISSTTSSITLINDATFTDNLVEDGIGDLLFIGDVAFHRVTNSDLG